MMSTYESPEIMENEDIAEGVFTASGSCYTTTARRTQVPETGRQNYVFQIDAVHNADHNSNKQQLVIVFSDPVTYVSCNGQGATYVSGNGTTTLTVNFSYWNNHTDNIGIGDFTVTSDASNLQYVSSVLYDVGQC